MRVTNDIRSGGIWCCLVILLAAGGCATPYQPRGFGGGYEDFPLQDNEYQVVFYGNGYTAEGRAKNLAMLRAAEVASANGFNYFVVKGVDSEASESMVYGDGYATVIRKPSVSMQIECLQEKPEDVPYSVFDAKQVRSNVMARYGLADPQSRQRSSPVVGEPK